MKFHTPGVRLRRRVIKTLEDFFEGKKTKTDVRRIAWELADYYDLPQPKLVFKKIIADDKQTVGITYDNGSIHIVDPKYKNELSYPLTCRWWVRTFLHEFGHYVFFAEAEKKANKFERKMGEGIL